jgi:hypothetical protein
MWQGVQVGNHNVQVNVTARDRGAREAGLREYLEKASQAARDDPRAEALAVLGPPLNLDRDPRPAQGR